MPFRFWRIITGIGVGTLFIGCVIVPYVTMLFGRNGWSMGGYIAGVGFIVTIVGVFISAAADLKRFHR